jgi:type I restriction enzyme S subunit
MKDADTIFPVPLGWNRLTVDQIKSTERSSCVAGPFGSKISSKYFVEAGVPVIRGSNLRDDLTRFIPEGFVFVSEDRAREYGPQHVKSGDLVFTCWGTIGQVGLIPEVGPHPEYIISNKQLKLRVNPEIADPIFCFYYLASPPSVAYIRNRGIGGAVPGINLGILKGLPIALPRLETQRRIANTLSAYDDLIENNRRRMALLEDSARQLYQEWFMQLRFPGHEHSRIIEGAPKGWERVAVPEALDINPTTRLSDANEHRWVEMADLPTDSMVIQNSILREGRSGSKFQNGDTLFARITPCLENGKTGFVDFLADGEVGRGSTEFIVLRSKRLTPEFVYCLARTYHFRENAIKSMIGSSGRQRVQESCFDKFFVSVPPRSLLNLFRDIAEPVFRQVKLLATENQKLRAARNLLLPRLMSGEVAV